MASRDPVAIRPQTGRRTAGKSYSPASRFSGGRITMSKSHTLHSVVVLAGTCFFLAAQPAMADPRAEAPATDAVQSAADLIDAHIFSRLQQAGVPPAERADDAEFLRRVWLDLAGKVPPVMEVRDFLASDKPD